MPRSVVDLSQLNALDAAIRAFDSNTGASMAAYSQSASNLLAHFEAKLNELFSIRQNALYALNSCEWRRASDPSISCAGQAAAFRRANERYSRCAELVNQARQAISEYDGYASRFRQAKSDLCSRARTGLGRVMATIEEYNSNATPNTDNVMSNGMLVPSTMSGPVENVPNDKLPGGGSFMFVRGGEQIAHVQHKGLGTDPVRIDPDAMADSLNHLPEITAPDKSTMRNAASGILAAMAAGGLVIGGREMLLQQKTDEIFENQYGISRTELLLKSGPKQKEYVAAYNNIYNGLQQEMKEIKKEEISSQIQKGKDFLALEDRRINELHGEVTLFSRELVHDKKIEIANLENQLASLEDGKKRAIVPSGKTKIGGLSEDGLSFMAEGMSSKKRFITVSNLLANSQATLGGDSGKEYVFKNGEADIFFVAHDGSYVNRYMRDFSQGFSEVETNVNLPEMSITGYSDKMNDSDVSLISISAEQKYKAEGIRVTNKTYHINQDGSAWTEVVNAGIGGEARAGASMNYKGAEMGAEVSVARAGLKTTYITAPSIQDGKFIQTEYGVNVEANAGVAIGVGTSKASDGTNELGAKIPFGKASIVYAKYNNLSENDFPKSIKTLLK